MRFAFTLNCVYMSSLIYFKGGRKVHFFLIPTCLVVVSLFPLITGRSLVLERLHAFDTTTQLVPDQGGVPAQAQVSLQHPTGFQGQLHAKL